MCARDIKYHQDKALQTWSTKADQKTSPLNGTRTTIKTASNVAVSKRQKGEDQFPPQDKVDDRIPCIKEHGDDRISPKYQECQEIDEDRMLSGKKMKNTESRQKRTMTKTKSRLTIKWGINKDRVMNYLQKFAPSTTPTR